MDENGGTPNPLNPMPVEENKASKPVAEPDDDIKFAEVGEVEEVKNPVKPASFAQTIAVEEVEPEPIVESVEMGAVIDTKLEPEPEPETEPTPEPEPKVSPASHNVVDPMMKPKKNNFDTLGMDDSGVNEIVDEKIVEEVSIAPSNDTASELVAKDSIVEPAGGDKKKIFIIGAIILVIIGIICGAAAIAIAVVGNGGDRVTKAIDKLINGESPNIVSVTGEITAENDSMGTSTNINFDGTFDLRTSANKVSANISADLFSGTNMAFGVDEIRNKNGNTYFKVSGLTDMLTNVSNASLKTTDATSVDAELITTNCVGDNSGLTNCQPQEGLSVTNLLSAYSGLFEVIDDEWVLISDDFGGTMTQLGLFDNNSTCLIDAFGSLPKYGKDIANKYKANPFVTYSTDKLGIAKKKNTLYKLGFDENKLTAFVNSLSNDGFINELNACAGNVATNEDVSVDTIKRIFDGFPTVYVEIDDNYNFARVYFEATVASIDTCENCEYVEDSDNEENIMAPENNSTKITADLNLSYPNELTIEEPGEYTDMSTLTNMVMKKFLTNGITIELPANY